MILRNRSQERFLISNVNLIYWNVQYIISMDWFRVTDLFFLSFFLFFQGKENDFYAKVIVFRYYKIILVPTEPCYHYFKLVHLGIPWSQFRTHIGTPLELFIRVQLDCTIPGTPPSFPSRGTAGRWAPGIRLKCFLVHRSIVFSIFYKNERGPIMKQVNQIEKLQIIECRYKFRCVTILFVI